MSVNLENSSSMSCLNPLGNCVLAGIASVSVNAVVHPLCTLKNRRMATSQTATSALVTTSSATASLVGRASWGGHPVRSSSAVGTFPMYGRASRRPLSRRTQLVATPGYVRTSPQTTPTTPKTSYRGLWNGYLAVCSGDALSFATSYVTNGQFQTTSPLLGAIGAGGASAPFESVAEGLMANRQVHGMPYSAALSRAVYPTGIVLTALRGIPFTTAVFYVTPIAQKALRQQIPSQYQSRGTELAIQALAGGGAGACAGFLTGPIDLVKTRVQTSDASVASPLRSIVSESGWRGMWRGSCWRGGYIGLTVAGMNIVNNLVPEYLPACLKRGMRTDHP